MKGYRQCRSTSREVLHSSQIIHGNARKQSTQATRPPAPVKQQSYAPAPQKSSGGGTLSGLSSTIAQGMAFGGGSAVAHRTVGAFADSFPGGVFFVNKFLVKLAPREKNTTFLSAVEPPKAKFVYTPMMRPHGVGSTSPLLACPKTLDTSMSTAGTHLIGTIRLAGPAVKTRRQGRGVSQSITFPWQIPNTNDSTLSCPSVSVSCRRLCHQTASFSVTLVHHQLPSRIAANNALPYLFVCVRFRAATGSEPGGLGSRLTATILHMDQRSAGFGYHHGTQGVPYPLELKPASCRMARYYIQNSGKVFK
eukprot:scaffold2767_cov177-Amphora_coffeaeformis.AAC.44